MRIKFCKCSFEYNTIMYNLLVLVSVWNRKMTITLVLKYLENIPRNYKSSCYQIVFGGGLLMSIFLDLRTVWTTSVVKIGPYQVLLLRCTYQWASDLCARLLADRSPKAFSWPITKNFPTTSVCVYNLFLFTSSHIFLLLKFCTFSINTISALNYSIVEIYYVNSIICWHAVSYDNT